MHDKKIEFFPTYRGLFPTYKGLFTIQGISLSNIENTYFNPIASNFQNWSGFEKKCKEYPKFFEIFQQMNEKLIL